jgi:hypothetical protein
VTRNGNKDGLPIDGDIARARAIVDALSKGQSSTAEVFAAFEELDALDPAAVRDALRPWTGPAPDPAQLDDAVRRAHGLPPPPLALRRAALVRDADVLDLGPVAEEQLRIAGKTWDGVDLPPEDRLDGEREDSFAGTLEHHALVEAETEQPMFDVLLYAGDAGVVFRAGTTELVGTIAYGRVEMRDRRVRVAIEEALARPIDEAPGAEHEPEPAGDDGQRDERSAPIVEAKSAGAKKKTAAKKKTRSAEKKTPAAKKKTASRKTTAKKKAGAKAARAAKKTASKKTAATRKAASRSKRTASANPDE